MSELAATSTDLVAAPSRGSAASRPAMPLKGVTQSIKGFASQPAVAKSLPMLGLLALAGMAALMWMTLSAPPERNLFQGLPDEDKAAVAEALKSAGVGYTIDRDTGALSVPESRYHEAKMLLAQQGLPKSAPDGGEVIDKLQLGSSRAVEAERLRGAREVDLARTIEAIEAVQSARVHLAVEQPSVFLRDRSRPAASVMLRLAPGRALGDAQVQAIVHLVASSVPGLAPDGVSVVDQTGRLLSSAGQGGVAEISEKQVAVQAKIEERYRQSLSQLLTPIIGEGNFTTEVHADVDFSETSATREGYPKDGAVLAAEEGSRSSEAGANGEAGGIPGALSNQPPPAAEVAAAPGGTLPGTAAQAFAGPANGASNENYNRQFAVGREVSVTKQQTGTIKRLSVAVALRNPEGAKPRGQEELAALESLVKGAIGFDQTRGDVVALSARSFAPVAVVEPTWYEAEWVWPVGRTAIGLIAIALIAFFVGKPMVKKMSAAMEQRAAAAREVKAGIGDEISDALAQQALADPNTKVTLAMIESAKGYEARAALVRTFVRQDPARAALVVRDLIKTDTGNGAEKNG